MKTSEDEKPTGYSAHRERQRKRILDAAEKLFSERSIAAVTMGQLTLASGVQPSTLYQYFPGKDDIVWALVGNIMGKLKNRPKRMQRAGASGLDKITDFLNYMADELYVRLADVRFMAQFDAMHSYDWPVERLLAVESETCDMSGKLIRSLILEGTADGSLRSDLNPDLTMQVVVNAAIGTQRRLASLGPKIVREYGQSTDRLFREALRLLVLGLKASDAGSVRRVKKTAQVPDQKARPAMRRLR